MPSISTTDKKTATCILNEYLKKTYGEDVLDFIGYKGDIGKTRLTALIQNALPKKEILSDSDIDIARMRVERHINEKSGVPITSVTGKKSDMYPWQKGRGVCNIEPEHQVEKKVELQKIETHPGTSPLPSRSKFKIKTKEKKKLPMWIIEQMQDEEQKKKPIKYKGYPKFTTDEIKCRVCGALMSQKDIVCPKCKRLRG